MVSSSKRKKKAIVFVDGNNWYHNVKKVIRKPRDIKIPKVAEMICKHFDLELVGIKYYNSIPNIESGEDNYYKHMVFLTGLKKQGVNVKTRKLKRVNENGVSIWVEKGVDLMIGSDIMDNCLIKEKCDTAVLISGDSDFIPVMDLVKLKGKEVLTASVDKGYARELMRGNFRFWIMKRRDLEACYLEK